MGTDGFDFHGPIPLRRGGNRAGMGAESDRHGMLGKIFAAELAYIQFGMFAAHLGEACIADMQIMAPDNGFRSCALSFEGRRFRASDDASSQCERAYGSRNGRINLNRQRSSILRAEASVQRAACMLRQDTSTADEIPCGIVTAAGGSDIGQGGMMWNMPKCLINLEVGL